MRAMQLASLLLLGCDAEPVRVLSGLDASTGVEPTDCSPGVPGCDVTSVWPDAGEPDAAMPSDAEGTAPDGADSALPGDESAADASDPADAAPVCQCRPGSQVACMVFSGESSACQVIHGQRVCQADGRWGECVGDAPMPMDDGFDLDAAVRGDAGIACQHYLIACPPEIYREISTGACEQTPLCPSGAASTDD